MQELVGKTIKKIFIDSDTVKFETDQGDICYTTYGDCCSVTYLHDFIGVENLLKNGLVKAVEEIDMSDDDDQEKCCRRCEEADCLSYYGYRIVTEDPGFGEVSSVLSFRNDSNGYYGGSLDLSDCALIKLPEIKKDWLND